MEATEHGPDSSCCGQGLHVLNDGRFLRVSAPRLYDDGTRQHSRPVGRRSCDEPAQFESNSERARRISPSRLYDDWLPHRGQFLAVAARPPSREPQSEIRMAASPILNHHSQESLRALAGHFAARYRSDRDHEWFAPIFRRGGELVLGVAQRGPRRPAGGNSLDGIASWRPSVSSGMVVGDQLAASIHTHVTSDTFSLVDIDTADSLGVPMLLVPPAGGEVLVYHPQPRMIETWLITEQRPLAGPCDPHPAGLPFLPMHKARSVSDSDHKVLIADSLGDLTTEKNLKKIFGSDIYDMAVNVAALYSGATWAIGTWKAATAALEWAGILAESPSADAAVLNALTAISNKIDAVWQTVIAGQKQALGFAFSEQNGVLHAAWQTAILEGKKTPPSERDLNTALTKVGTVLTTLVSALNAGLTDPSSSGGYFVRTYGATKSPDGTAPNSPEYRVGEWKEATRIWPAQAVARSDNLIFDYRFGMPLLLEAISTYLLLLGFLAANCPNQSSNCPTYYRWSDYSFIFEGLRAPLANLLAKMNSTIGQGYSVWTVNATSGIAGPPGTFLYKEMAADINNGEWTDVNTRGTISNWASITPQGVGIYGVTQNYWSVGGKVVSTSGMYDYLWKYNIPSDRNYGSPECQGSQMCRLYGVPEQPYLMWPELKANWWPGSNDVRANGREDARQLLKRAMKGFHVIRMIDVLSSLTRNVKPLNDANGHIPNRLSNLCLDLALLLPSPSPPLGGTPFTLGTCNQPADWWTQKWFHDPTTGWIRNTMLYALPLSQGLAPQNWCLDVKTQSVRSKLGLEKVSRPGSNVIMTQCKVNALGNPSEPGQIWSYDHLTGILRNGYGTVLDGINGLFRKPLTTSYYDPYDRNSRTAPQTIPYGALWGQMAVGLQ